MTSPYRNKSKYETADDETNKPLAFRSDANLEKAWQERIKRDPLRTLYTEARAVNLSRSTVTCDGFTQTLDALHMATGDERFQAAAKAMKDHDLLGGHVKQKLMSIALSHRCFRAEWAAMPDVHLWVGTELVHKDDYGKILEKKTVGAALAAKLVAIDLAIPGDSFAAVVTDIRKLYPIWKAEIMPDGLPRAVLEKLTTK